MLCCANEPITHVWVPFIPNGTSVYVERLNSPIPHIECLSGSAQLVPEMIRGWRRAALPVGVRRCRQQHPEIADGRQQGLRGRAQPGSLCLSHGLWLFLKRSPGAAVLVEETRGCRL